MLRFTVKHIHFPAVVFKQVKKKATKRRVNRPWHFWLLLSITNLSVPPLPSFVPRNSIWSWATAVKAHIKVSVGQTGLPHCYKTSASHWAADSDSLMLFSDDSYTSSNAMLQNKGLNPTALGTQRIQHFSGNGEHWIQTSSDRAQISALPRRMLSSPWQGRAVWPSLSCSLRCPPPLSHLRLDGWRILMCKTGSDIGTPESDKRSDLVCWVACSI